jgi:hypothetical protein
MVTEDGEVVAQRLPDDDDPATSECALIYGDEFEGTAVMGSSPAEIGRVFEVEVGPLIRSGPNEGMKKIVDSFISLSREFKTWLMIFDLDGYLSEELVVALMDEQSISVETISTLLAILKKMQSRSDFVFLASLETHFEASLRSTQERAYRTADPWEKLIVRKLVDAYFT